MKAPITLVGTCAELGITPECGLRMWRDREAEIVGKRRDGTLILKLSPSASSFVIGRLAKFLPRSPVEPRKPRG